MDKEPSDAVWDRLATCLWSQVPWRSRCGSFGMTYGQLCLIQACIIVSGLSLSVKQDEFLDEDVSELVDRDIVLRVYDSAKPSFSSWKAPCNVEQCCGGEARADRGVESEQL